MHRYRIVFGLGFGVALAVLGWRWSWHTAPTTRAAEAIPQRTAEQAASRTRDSVAAEDPKSVAPDSAAARHVHGSAVIANWTVVPPGRFRDELAALAPAVREKVLARLTQNGVPLLDAGSLRVTAAGDIYYECQIPRSPPESDENAAGQGASDTLGATSPAPAVFHSRPGAPNTIYLDFTGGTISGTVWNEGTDRAESYVAVPYDSDESPATYSEAEQDFIRAVWRIVAEDFAPFDVDVTTERPDSFGPRTGRVLITKSRDDRGVNMPSSTAAGVAFLSVFGTTNYATRYSPALVYYDRLYSDARYVAEVASHEMGHNLGLNHDGTTTSEYYEGHGYSRESWAPIMGASYYRTVTQWSKGEYLNANNLQDDLAIMAGRIAYAADEHGDTTETATALSTDAFTAAGVIQRTGEVDSFRITLPLTGVTVVAQSTDSGNAELMVELVNAATGTPVSGTIDPYAGWRATGFNAGVAAGDYIVRVKGVGLGSPQTSSPTGFTAYGSLGAYTLRGTLSAITAPSLYYQSADRSVYVAQSADFYAVFNASPTPLLRWQRRAAGQSEWQDLSDGGAYSGTQSPSLLVVATLAMHGDQFRCKASNIGGDAYSAPRFLNVAAAVAPQIYNVPTLLPVEFGSSFSINLSISGSSPFTYQWSKDGVAVPDATSSSYYKSSATAADAGTYTLTVTNAGGSATSSGTVVSVAAARAPGIFGLSQNVRVSYGNSLSLYPTVTGTQPMTSQWYRNGFALTGDTGTSLYRYGATPDDSGTYWLTVSNSVGTATSIQINVVVAAATLPTVTMPGPLTVGTGSTISIYPSITGSGAMSYQWRKDGVAIEGATSSYFYKSSATAANDAGVYTIEITNPAGTVTSGGVQVVVNPPAPPAINFGENRNFTVAFGGYLSFSASVTGTAPITYQWSKDGVAIAGATSSYFWKSEARPADSGIYVLTATNSVGTATLSLSITVSAAQAPVIFGLPTSYVTNVGGQLSLYPSVIGSSPLSLQWWKDGEILPGATFNALSLSNVTTGDAGAYRIVATNPAGRTEGPIVNVIVDPAILPGIYGLPATVSLNYGGNLGLSPIVTGSGPFTYRWYRDGVAISGATGNYINRYSVTNADAGSYTLQVTNAAGTVTSAPVVVSVNPAIAPTILNLPATMSVAFGSSLSLSPQVTGTSPMTASWTKNGTVIVGADSIGLNRYQVNAADSGVYRLTVTNVAGTAVSSECTVTVAAPILPTVTFQYPEIVAAHGSYFAIYPSIRGSAPMTYQWRRNGTNIAGTNNSSFSRSQTTSADAGSYTLVVTNAAGTTVSPAVTVIVNDPIPPAVYGLPSAVAVNHGESFYLHASIVGTDPLSLQWQRNGVDLANANSPYYSGSRVTSDDGGDYTLVVTSPYGTATSSIVKVTVNSPVGPAIYNVSDDRTLEYGDQLSLSATVTGSTPMALQWSKDGVPIAGATYSSFSKYYMTTAEAGQYALTATNAFGTATTRSVIVTVRPAIAPTITSQPESREVALGLRVPFSVTVEGTSPRSYQWYFNGAPIPDATSSTLTLARVAVADYGTYHVVVSNPGGSTRSDDCTLAPDSGLPVVSVAAGASHSAWVRSDGSLWVTGSNYHGQLGAAGTNPYLLPLRLASDVRAVRAGQNFTLFLKRDGTLWGCGQNAAGQLGGIASERRTPAQIASDVVSFAGGAHTTYFVKADGTLWSLGDNNYSQLGDGSSAQNRTTPIQIATDVTQVAAGASHALFLKTDGTLWTFGAGASGRLGDGAQVNRGTPVQVAQDVKDCAGGSSHSAFVKNDGTLWTMGSNNGGELGDGTTIDRLLPIQVATEVKAVWAAERATFFLKVDNTLHGCGNDNGRLGQNSYGSILLPILVANDVSDVAASGNFLLLIRADGELWGGGASYSGQLGIGLNDYSVALRAILRVTAVAPVVMEPPTSQQVTVGAPATFTVTAAGTLPMSYQWRRNGRPLPDATGASLAVSGVSRQHVGTYDVVVSNAMGETVSSSAQLAVEFLPQTIQFAPLSDRSFTTQPLALAATATSELPVSFSVVAGPAQVSGSSLVLSGAGSVTVRATQEGDEVFDPAPAVERTFAVTGNFSSWSLAHFSSAELEDAAVAGLQADPDGDGFSNFLEYALGLSPRASSADPAVVAATDTEWSYTFTRPSDRPDLTYTVECSTNLATWSSDYVTLTLVSTSDGIETWRATTPRTTGPNCFLRLRVTR